jgi:hypothetical protein
MSTTAPTQPRRRRLQQGPVRTAQRSARTARRSAPPAAPYRDGESFDAGQTRWPEMTVYGFRHGAHELRLFRAAPDAALEAAVRAGSAALRVVPRGALTLLMVRLTPDAPWEYAPVSWWLLPDEDAREVAAGDVDAPMRLVLVDGRSGQVRASSTLHRAVRVRRGLWHTLRAQSAQPGTLLEVAAELRQVQTAAVHAHDSGAAGA